MESTNFKKYTEYKDKLISLAKRIGFDLDLDNPKTIQDKLNWLKIYDSTPLKTKCADKIKLHEYCQEKLGEDLCVPIISVYDKPEDIEWDKLPRQFVIKCNHGSGMNIIVKDKNTVNRAEVNRKLARFMKDDFAFHVGYEMHYHDIPHKIFVETYMSDEKQNASLLDYKFWCFNGTPRFMTVNDGNGHGRMNFYDMQFNKISLERTDFREMAVAPQKPATFEKMIEYAKKLSDDFKFVRVDFYEISGKLYLGELTFTPGAGFFKFRDPKNNRKVGDMLVLGLNSPEHKKKVLIVHYNTQKVTEACIKSINKHMKNCQIYIFDNSDKTPFVNTFQNVVVIDNTNGKVVDFDKIIKKHEAFYNRKALDNNFGSFKHCISVETAMNLLDDNFVLMDSDVLIKKDFSSLYDDSKIFVGKIEKMAHFKKRVEPFLVFINTRMCKEKNVHFYNENRMWGFYDTPGENYDTGCWFYEACAKYPKKEVSTFAYMEHFRAASWYKDAVEKQKYRKMSPEIWLNRHESLWKTDNEPKGNPVIENKYKIYTCEFSEIFDHIYCLHHLPNEDRLNMLKRELKRVDIDENANYFSWVYDYPSELLDLVYNNISTDSALRAPGRDFLKRVSMKHYEIIKEAYEYGFNRILIMEDDIRFHKDFNYINKAFSNIPDTDVVMFDKMVCSKPGENVRYKEYIKTLPEGALYGSMNDSGVFFIFGSCYSLNRKAMKRIIELQEKSLLPTDTPLNDKELTGSFAIINLAIQDPSVNTRRVEGYDKIGLDMSLYFNEKKVTISLPKPPALKPAPAPKKPAAQKVTLGPRHHINQVKKAPVPPKPALKKPIKHIEKPVNSIKTITRRLPVKFTGHNKLYDVY